MVKMKPVGGGYTPTDYATEFHKVRSHDGTEIPLYLVYRKDAIRSRPAPLLPCTGMVHMESAIRCIFSSARLSLLDRGIIFAVAHVRGGGELGKQWVPCWQIDAKEEYIPRLSGLCRILDRKPDNQC